MEQVCDSLLRLQMHKHVATLNLDISFINTQPDKKTSMSSANPVTNCLIALFCYSDLFGGLEVITTSW